MCAAPPLGFAEITNARRHPRSRPLFLNIVTIQASKAEPSAGSFSPGGTQAQAQGESCPRVSGDALSENSNLYRGVDPETLIMGDRSSSPHDFAVVMQQLPSSLLLHQVPHNDPATSSFRRDKYLQQDDISVQESWLLPDRLRTETSIGP